MDRMSNVADRDGVFEAPGAQAWPSSPFAGGGLRALGGAAAAESGDREHAETGSASWLVSPFSEGLLDSAGPESEAAFTALRAELHDEAFDEAVQALIDEAAGRYLTSAESWSESTSSRTGEVEAWMAGIAAQADQLFEQLERQFGARTPESLQPGEFETALEEALAAQGLPDLGGEGFLGALTRKLGSFVKGAAKWGLSAIASRLLSPLIKIFQQMVHPLLRAALAAVYHELPDSFKADAATLAARLGITLPTVAAEAAPPAGPGAALAELFDTQLAQAALTDNQAMADQLLAEWESIGDHEDGGAVARLDAARTALAQQLAEAEPGSVLTAELEQFIPAVMAALPLIRYGVKIAGRGNVVGLLAKPLAQLMASITGKEASKALARAIADKGLQMLRLEAEAPSDRLSQLGAEALVSTLEDTIRAVGYLPPESQAEPLRVRAEAQEAFAEAAARHLPSEMLRADLDVPEMGRESGVWVLMPRGSYRPYRYRKYSITPSVQISRPVARAIVLADGGTLEQRLLDEGATGWPAEAEVHLYEPLPGTYLGHLAASETGYRGGPVDRSEFEELTPQTAGLLFNQPGLGRIPAGAVGRRYYRLVIPGRAGAVRRHVKRVAVRVVRTGPRPLMQVGVSLTAREAHRVAELLAEHADVRLVALFRSLILGLAERSLPSRIARQAQRVPGVVLTTEQAKALAAVMGEQMVTAVAAQLRVLGPTLAAAARDRAQGVTLAFEFGFADPAAIAAGRPDAPTVAARPGRRHD